MTSNPYEILGVAPGVSSDELKRCYRKRLRAIHPDLNPDDPDATTKTKRLLEAYALLSDPTQRAQLDAQFTSPDVAQKSETGPPAPDFERHKPRDSKNRVHAQERGRPRQTSTSQTGVTINGQKIDTSSADEGKYDDA